MNFEDRQQYQKLHEKFGANGYPELPAKMR
jgi:hypothetical protein